MTCILCAATPIEKSIAVRDCPTCAGKRQFLLEDYEWYGPTLTCLTCGEEWNDGERAPRPFAPGWRQRNIAAALERATRAGLVTG